MSLCDLQGVPYPAAPEGQHRYRISVNYARGASFCDYHKMWIGVNAKEAAKLCLDYLANSPDTKQLRGLFGATPELINQVLTIDVDSQDMNFFFGADLSENAETDALTTVFRHMSGMDDTEQEMDLNSLFESFGKLF
jgi:hypothetical protein